MAQGIIIHGGTIVVGSGLAGCRASYPRWNDCQTRRPHQGDAAEDAIDPEGHVIAPASSMANPTWMPGYPGSLAADRAGTT